nr:hypothetical protein DM860_005930 [Ipomoea batatas]
MHHVKQGRARKPNSQLNFTHLLYPSGMQNQKWNMITAFQAYSHVKPAGKFYFPLFPLDDYMFLEIIPPGVQWPVIQPSVHKLFVHGNSGPQSLISQNCLNENFWKPALIIRKQVLSLDYINSQVPKFGRKVYLRPYIGKAISPANSCCIRMPCLGECLISLSTHPNSQHQLASSSRLISLPVLQPIPLRCQRTIGRNPLWNLIQIKQNPTNKIILNKILIFHRHLKHRCLNPVLGESKHLIPFRVAPLLKVARSSLVVSQPNLHIRIKTSCNILPWQILGFHNPDIKVLHLLNKVIGTSKLIT